MLGEVMAEGEAQGSEITVDISETMEGLERSEIIPTARPGTSSKKRSIDPVRDLHRLPTTLDQ